MGITLSLQSLQQDNTILLLSDSQVAVQSVVNLCQGHPPRTGIERQTKELLADRQKLPTGHRSRLGARTHKEFIPGNEAANKLANWSSHLGQTSEQYQNGYGGREGGLRAIGKSRESSSKGDAQDSA